MSFPDPRPQAEIRTVSGNNVTEPRNPYVDQNITRRNITGSMPAPPAFAVSVKATGPIRSTYANDQKSITEVDVSGQSNIAPLPNSQPLAIVTINNIPRERSYYANNGMHGQSFFKNSTAS